MVLIPLKRKLQNSPPEPQSNTPSSPPSTQSPNVKKAKPSSLPSPSSTLPKLGMIELNGTLLSPSVSLSTSTLTELGLFYLDGQSKCPTLVVGTHKIKGRRVGLKKGMLVCRKMGGEGGKGGGGGLAEVKGGVEIVGVIEEKFLFDSYPKTIMRTKER
ncbi:hypothetical protein TrCOL_g3123 [Triparma columacea]|uniref:Uncharacterized protein n=1 Tax=Triparma columacea TaxID=722753 RepID=A0A9W7FXI5_9STRA|nr:hypothetical protein TrCOL_g3123 [Triparma columacea]